MIAFLQFAESGKDNLALLAICIVGSVIMGELFFKPLPKDESEDDED